jgi:chromosome partitioning protein
MFETELVIINRAARERILVNYIEDNLEFFSQYDHILIDTNPSMSILNQNAFLAADSLILVTDADDNSKVGLELFMHLWGRIRRDLRKPDNVKALILNRAKLDTNTTRDILDYFHKHDELGPLLIPQIIRAKEVYKNAAANRVPINMLKPSDKAKKKDILEASGEIRKAVEFLEERGIF